MENKTYIQYLILLGLVSGLYYLGVIPVESLFLVLERAPWGH